MQVRSARAAAAAKEARGRRSIRVGRPSYQLLRRSSEGYSDRALTITNVQHNDSASRRSSTSMNFSHPTNTPSNLQSSNTLTNSLHNWFLSSLNADSTSAVVMTSSGAPMNPLPLSLPTDLRERFELLLNQIQNQKELLKEQESMLESIFIHQMELQGKNFSSNSNISDEQTAEHKDSPLV